MRKHSLNAARDDPKLSWYCGLCIKACTRSSGVMMASVHPDIIPATPFVTIR